MTSEKKPERSLADELRALIAAEQGKGTSLNEIARRADVAAPSVSKLMNGKTVTIETLSALAKALGYDVLLKRRQ